MDHWPQIGYYYSVVFIIQLKRQIEFKNFLAVIGPSLIFSQPTWPIWHNSPQKCSPVQSKTEDLNLLHYHTLTVNSPQLAHFFLNLFLDLEQNVDVWRLVSRINIVGNLIWVLCPLGSCFVTFFKLTRENMSKFSRDNVWNSISSNNKYARKTSVGLIFVLFVLYLNNHHENLLERNGLKIQINKETNKTNLIKKYCLEIFFCIFFKN